MPALLWDISLASDLPVKDILQDTKPEGIHSHHCLEETSLEELNGPTIPLAPPRMLSEVADTLRRSKYQRRKCHQTQRQVQCLHFANARTSRLIFLSRSIQRTLAECIRSEDKQSFGNLFNALHDASDSALLSTPLCQDDTIHMDDDNGYPSSFLDLLPSQSRRAIKDLLSKVRCDADFIAGRLASLSNDEVLDLLPGRGTARSSESIFSSASGSGTRASRQLGFAVDGQVEQLSSLDFDSPLQTLFCCVRGISSSDIAESRREVTLWASVCARIFVEQKPGTKLVPAILDLFVTPSTWPGKLRLELWILQTVQKGAFIVDQPNKRSFSERMTGLPEASYDVIQAELFYERAVDSLLDLLGDESQPSVIPGVILDVCRAIWNNLSSEPAYQRIFPNFVLKRWLFLSFINDTVTLPEVCLIDIHQGTHLLITVGLWYGNRLLLLRRRSSTNTSRGCESSPKDCFRRCSPLVSSNPRLEIPSQLIKCQETWKSRIRGDGIESPYYNGQDACQYTKCAHIHGILQSRSSIRRMRRDSRCSHRK